MDEIFGFFPPVANPPSKTPLLTLLKQARAFGVGIVLATQNPVDLDYKGLSNAGTWFIGRLQTERDKARVLEGLEGVAANSGVKWDRQAIEQTLAGLSNRVFLMHNVHNNNPLIFETRWAMSYLCGPLTRHQIKLLMDPVKNQVIALPAETLSKPAVSAIRPQTALAAAPTQGRPDLPPDIPQYFIPVQGYPAEGQHLFYQPAVMGSGTLHYLDVKAGVNLIKSIFYLGEVINGPLSIDWNTAAEIDLNLNDLEQLPREPAQYGELPAIAFKSESYAYWSKDFVNWLYRSQKIDLWKSPGLKEYSRVNESERDFRVRLQQKAREQRDEAIEKLRQKYSPQFVILQEQMRRAQASVDRKITQVRSQKSRSASFRATILGDFLGNKSTGSKLGGTDRNSKASKDIQRAESTVEAIQQKMHQLEAGFKADTDGLSARMDLLTEQLESIQVRPAKTAITIQLLALGWIPLWQTREGKLIQAW